MMATVFDQSRFVRGDTAFTQLLPEVDPTDGEMGVRNFIAEPERRLLFAVLTDAIVRFRRFAEAPNDPGRRDCVEAERWIRSSDREWPCSFVNVCEALDIEPGPLRRALLAWRNPGSTRRRATRRGLLVKRRRSRAAADATATTFAETED